MLCGSLDRRGVWGENGYICCRKGALPGPKTSLRNELSKETHVLTKQEILLGKGTQAESSRVRDPRRTVLAVL